MSGKRSVDVSLAHHALVVVDVQKGFLTPPTEVVLPHIHDLARRGYGLVVATAFFNSENSSFRDYMGWNALGTPEETALDPVVYDSADVVLEKETYSAGDVLVKALLRRRIWKATVVGIDTDVCVVANASLLFERGIETFVDLDGCASTGGEESEKAAEIVLRRVVGRDHVFRESELMGLRGAHEGSSGVTGSAVESRGY